MCIFSSKLELTKTGADFMSYYPGALCLSNIPIFLSAPSQTGEGALPECSSVSFDR